MSWSGLVKTLNDSMTPGERVLVWRLTVTLLIGLHIAWAWSLIPGLDGFVLKSEHTQLEHRVQTLIEEEVFGSVNSLKLEVSALKDSQFEARKDHLRSTLFEVEARLCELNSNGKTGTGHHGMVVEKLRTLLDRFESLTGRRYPLNKCTGLR